MFIAANEILTGTPTVMSSVSDGVDFVGLRHVKVSGQC
jgi:hypothetical protein